MVSNIFQTRCQALLDQLPDGSGFVCHSGNPVIRNHDAHYPFRSDSNMLYLSGCNQPNHQLIGVKNQNHHQLYLVTPKISHHDIVWHGVDLPKSFSTNHYDATLSLKDIDDILDTLDIIYTPSAQRGMISQFTESLDPFMVRLRRIKSDDEIELIQKATQLSVLAHQEVMAHRDHLNTEAQALSIYLATCCQHQCFEQAYHPIVAGAHHANILHYNHNNGTIHNGAMLLLDAGIEFQSYASDITRTFPTKKHFSKEQSLLYEIVLAAQVSALESVKPGIHWAELNLIAQNKLIEGLLSLQILSPNHHDQLIKTLHTWYPHGIGHSLGIDVHDPSDRHQPLEAGMTITIEPGLYMRPDKDLDERWHNIGIRIEDTILVTESGHINFSKELPKTIEDIEAS